MPFIKCVVGQWSFDSSDRQLTTALLIDPVISFYYHYRQWSLKLLYYSLLDNGCVFILYRPNEPDKPGTVKRVRNFHWRFSLYGFDMGYARLALN